MPRSMTVDRLSPTDPESDSQLAAFFDACPTSFAQQTPEWRDVIAPLGPDEPIFLGCRREGRLVGVLPAYRFSGPLGAILTSVPQAGPLGGVACLPDVDRAPVYEGLLAAFLEQAAVSGCALASVITNPFWPDRELYDRFLEPDYVLENSCQVVDLETALDAGGEWVGSSAHVKRNLRKACGGALLIDDEQSPENVAEWYGIHATRHREIGAEPLPEGIFTGALAHMVPRERARFFFVRRADGGEMVAGGFYVFHGRVIDALMPSMRKDRAHLAPNYLLALHSMRWARERGLRYYNWQGSPPGSGVYRFKTQWGSRDLPYYFLTRITGDAAPFVRGTVERIRTDYRWHYALPYDRIGAADSSGGVSSRAAAWEALGAADRAAEDRMRASVVDHYERRLRAHGPTARGMDWKDEASQRLRFELLCGVCDLGGRSVHEIGAGVGHLHDFLRDHGIEADYSGSDLSSEMVASARERLPGVPFVRRDILLDPPAERYDVLLCSGLFHVMLDNPENEWLRFVRGTVRAMYDRCRLAIAFNLMSDDVDFRTENLYYSDAGEMLRFCERELSRFVVLRDDYPLYEYTIYVYRDPSVARPELRPPD